MQMTPRGRAGWIAHVWKAATQQHHRALRSLFAPFVPADAVVIDVGAHAGQFSKLFARMARRGAIYAFEPSEYARSVMVPAVAVSGLRNITLIPMGLSDARGEMVLHTPIKHRGGMGFGLAHLGADDGAREMMDQTVRLTTLDAFAAERNLQRLDFIKADIEGWELQALRGGAATLARFRPALYLEVDDECLARAGSTPADLWALLEPLGYKARTTPGLSPVSAYQGAGDYLFVAEHGRN
jgi:FkbM family methyltransferase